MKRLKFMVVGTAILLGCVAPVQATSINDQLEISSGGLIAIIGDGGVCINVAGSPCAGLSGDISIGSGMVQVTGSINGWTLTSVIGTTESPNVTPFGLDLTSVVASCSVSGGCTGANALDIRYSDVGFTTPVLAGGLFATYSAAVTGGGSTSDSAFIDNTNVRFNEPAGGLIGTLGPFTAPSMSGSVGGGPMSFPPYSLTVDQTFSGGGTQFSVDGEVTAVAPAAVPEPSTLTLTALGLAGLVRRYRHQRSQ
jgi:hypothetical protein